MLKILSILLQYPTKDWLQELDVIEAYAKELNIEQSVLLAPLFRKLESSDEIDLQVDYVATFDRTPTHALHLFEHLHGEDRERGQAMVDLLQTYQREGFEPEGNELPDFLPLFLEFLANIDINKAAELLGDAIHVINYIGENLEKNNSPYSAIFTVLKLYSPVNPEPLKVAPIRNMDEAMEHFGPNMEGVEPLLPHSGLSFQSKMAMPNCQKCH